MCFLLCSVLSLYCLLKIIWSKLHIFDVFASSVSVWFNLGISWCIATIVVTAAELKLKQHRWFQVFKIVLLIYALVVVVLVSRVLVFFLFAFATVFWFARDCLSALLCDVTATHVTQDKKVQDLVRSVWPVTKSLFWITKPKINSVIDCSVADW